MLKNSNLLEKIRTCAIALAMAIQSSLGSAATNARAEVKKKSFSLPNASSTHLHLLGRIFFLLIIDSSFNCSYLFNYLLIYHLISYIQIFIRV